MEIKEYSKIDRIMRGIVEEEPDFINTRIQHIETVDVKELVMEYIERELNKPKYILYCGSKKFKEVIDSLDGEVTKTDEGYIYEKILIMESKYMPDDVYTMIDYNAVDYTRNSLLYTNNFYKYLT